MVRVTKRGLEFIPGTAGHKAVLYPEWDASHHRAHTQWAILWTPISLTTYL